jgi:hypothetical protein
MSEARADHDIVCLATAGSSQEAHLWRQALEDEGICCRVVGEFLGSFGVAPPGYPVPEIWVRRQDAPHARQVLEQLRASAGRAEMRAHCTEEFGCDE